MKNLLGLVGIASLVAFVFYSGSTPHVEANPAPEVKPAPAPTPTGAAPLAPDLAGRVLTLEMEVANLSRQCQCNADVKSQPQIHPTAPDVPKPPAKQAAWTPPAGYVNGGNGWYYPPGYNAGYSSGTVRRGLFGRSRSCGPGGCN